MRRLASLAVATCFAAMLAACSRPAQPAAFDPQRAYRDVEAQVALGPRLPGSPASDRLRAYLRGELARAGWRVEVDRWTFAGVGLENLLAKRGRGPAVLIAAHYDTRACADRDPHAPSAPVAGANDGASGVAVLLELARTLDPQKLHNGVWLAFLDAEDQGGLQGWPWSVGARRMAETLATRPQFVIVVDMVGDGQQELYWEASSTPWLRERVWSLAADLGYGSNFVAREKYSIIDDHTPFLERGIPAIDIIDLDYAYWHTIEDTADKVSPASLERVGRVLKRLLETPGATDLP